MNMKRILFSLIAFLAIGSHIKAESSVNVIKVDDVEITPGGEATIDIKYDATNEPENGLRGLQFAIYIPDGFNLKSTKVGPLTMVTVQQGPISNQMFDITPSIADNGRQIRFVMKHKVQGALFSYLAEYSEPLFSVTLVANANVSPGIYDAYAKGYGSEERIQMAGPTSTGDVTYYYEPINFKINVPIVLNEEISYDEGFGNNPGVKMIMEKRTLKADTWNTICLPFDMTATQVATIFGDDAKIAEYSSFDQTEKDGDINLFIKFRTKSENSISANVPCLLKVSQAISKFELETVDVSDDTPTIIDGALTFVGNYHVYDNSDKLDNAIYISGNKFYIAKGNTIMKAFRGYFTHTSLNSGTSNPANVSVFVDDEPTGIRSLNAEQDEDEIYDLAGRKVDSSKNALQKGVYIINGKKETIH